MSNQHHLPVISPSEITAIVLAGGQGSRMGGLDKGWVEHKNRPMIETITEKLTTRVGKLLISANRNIERYQTLGFPVIPDAADIKKSDDFEGPIAGIISCMRRSETELMIIVPCDAPLFSMHLVENLCRQFNKTHSKLTLYEVEGHLQPLFGLFSQSLLPSLEKYYGSGERKLVHWCKLQGPDIIKFKGDLSEFANFNAPTDFL